MKEFESPLRASLFPLPLFFCSILVVASPWNIRQLSFPPQLPQLTVHPTATLTNRFFGGPHSGIAGTARR